MMLYVGIVLYVIMVITLCDLMDKKHRKEINSLQSYMVAQIEKYDYSLLTSGNSSGSGNQQQRQ